VLGVLRILKLLLLFVGVKTGAGVAAKTSIDGGGAGAAAVVVGWGVESFINPKLDCSVKPSPPPLLFIKPKLLSPLPIPVTPSSKFAKLLKSLAYDCLAC